MITKCLQIPQLVYYSRRFVNGKRMEYREPSTIKVPLFLESLSYNPFLLSKMVNELVICDYVDGQLKDNIEKTVATKELIIKHSPRIMRNSRTKKVWVKDNNAKIMKYFPLKNDPVDLIDPLDYIATKDAASLYVKALGICTPEELTLFEKEDRINFFLADGNSHFGSEKERRNMRLFLLNEINSLC